MSGKFPSIWKVAKVTPLYKGGLKTERDIIDQYQYCHVSLKSRNLLQIQTFKLLHKTLALLASINMLTLNTPLQQ